MGSAHRLFQAGMVVKGIDGVLEIGGGLLVALVHVATLNRWVVFLTTHELHALGRGVSHLASGDRTFASAYLIGHGIIKVFLVAGLLAGKRWAYPTALALMGAFLCYQGIRLTHHLSTTLIVLTAFDVAIVLLVWNEWRHARVSPAWSLPSAPASGA